MVVGHRISFREVFARFLRKARGQRSQSEIARAVGVKPQSVNEWESGKYLPDSRRVESLIEVLGFDGVGAAHALATAASEIQAEAVTERHRNAPVRPTR
jgi:DNA-binding XRE family transcriptional regulator